MGKTFVIFKINARDMENLSKTEEDLRACKNGECRDIRQEPIGFGVIVLKAGFTIPEKDDSALESLTKEIEALDSVESVEVEGMTLL
jgi:translation elongation factor EF-1beta